MFVLVEKNQFVVVGPIEWNARIFQSELEDQNIKILLPKIREDSLPIIINNDYKILSVRICNPQTHNSKIEQFAGPFWEFTDTIAVGTYVNVDKHIDVVKHELKKLVADNRWKQEIKGIQVLIQEQVVFVSTKRGDRDVYAQSIVLNNVDKQWKFGNCWLILSLEDLQKISIAILTHVQQAFDWEQTKINEINNAQTLQELNDVVLIYQE